LRILILKTMFSASTENVNRILRFMSPKLCDMSLLTNVHIYKFLYFFSTFLYTVVWKFPWNTACS
jgi:hypothetical protein